MEDLNTEKKPRSRTRSTPKPIAQAIESDLRKALERAEKTIAELREKLVETGRHIMEKNHLIRAHEDSRAAGMKAITDLHVRVKRLEEDRSALVGSVEAIVRAHDLKSGRAIPTQLPGTMAENPLGFLFGPISGEREA